MLSADTTVTVSKPEPQASNTFLPLLPPTVFLKSTNDLLMPSPKQRLMPMLPPHTTVDTTDTVPDTTAVDTDTDTAVDTDTVMAVNLNIKLHSVATRGPPQMSSRVLDFVNITDEKTVKWDDLFLS